VDKDLVKPVKKARLYEGIVEQIKQLIIEGKLKPLDVLPPERELAAMFNVGRPTIREAIQALMQLCLIETAVEQKRVRIRDFAFTPYIESMKDHIDWMLKTDKATIQQLTEFRASFEECLALLAAERATTTQLKEMENLIEAMEKKVREKDVRGYLESAIDFHKVMADATQNIFFHTVWLSLSDCIMAHYIGVMERSGEDLSRKLYLTNVAIYKAIQSKDLDEVRSSVGRHIEQNRKVASMPNGNGVN